MSERTPILPDDDEVEQIVLGPDSLVWQTFGNARLFFGAGYALMLQVAHPTVGSGVRDHSTFEQDPWGRLLRTMDYLYLFVYGGRDAAAMGRRLRHLHKQIKGTNADGSRYHALEPEAYAWVHATLMESGFARGRGSSAGSARPTVIASTPNTCHSGASWACGPVICRRAALSSATTWTP